MVDRKSFALLPEDSLVIDCCHGPAAIKSATIPTGTYQHVFFHTAADPVNDDVSTIQDLLEDLKRLFPGSRVWFLTSRCEHYLYTIPNIVWYPYWLLNTRAPVISRERSKRMGCLNRRSSAHRSWLMYNLLKENLIDHERDIFSIRFDLDKMREIPAEIDQDFVMSLPATAATIEDGFPNDHSIDHPAWNTAIAIVTETKQDERAILTEKTAKAILSGSCWMLYSGEASVQVLQDLGFELLFDQQANGWNVQPILDICRELKDQSSALDYRQSRLPQIEHNLQWFLDGTWIKRYQHKIHTDHDLL